ncbi:eCIS core domain-containing protein [Streptomyces noursei]|uniref:eCIS core domain-containing protein n=1 Tax=Streptomyces noursei TaxID=1971 RepID=A0A401R689_STRNR|nr:DUF4157 domain-containing protein [Streptomyces noursei]GCB93137.1 hypothetical protein SALB_05916 [Streptomyces noursei]
MSNTNRSATQDDRSARDARRRKRKERSAKSAAPEPKNIVSGAGQPLDLSVRRELEEQLGHDFSQVRLHTDRDSGRLADLMGADAFAVGRDVFFREGAYRPGTADGRRLLAHELLHTVQDPHGPGALRAGRDLGAVSLPQEAIEREAEDAAQESVRAAMLGTTRPDHPTPTVEPGQQTPGWLRYATVDADRHRSELIDPATLVDRLANGVLRSLRGDPEDRSKRARMQLAQLPDELQDAVLERLERRLLSSEQERLLDLVTEIEDDADMERSALDAPMVETDPAEELRFARESERRTANERRAQAEEPDPAPGPEKDEQAATGATGSTPRNGGTRKDGTTPQGGGAPGGPVADGGNAEQPSKEERGTPAADASGAPGAAPAAQAPQSASAAPGSPSADKTAAGEQSTDGKSAGGAQADGQRAGGKEDGKGTGADGKEGTERAGTPVASKEESAAKNRPGAVDALVAGKQLKSADKRGQEQPTGSPVAARAETQQPGAASTLDGVRTQDLDGPETHVDEDPFGQGSESEVDVGGGEPSAWDVTLQPDDYLPAQDLDVSAVPTADTLDPSSSGGASAPSFPAPPVTKADKVQAERDAEDAEDAAAESEPDTADDVDDAPAGAETGDADGAGAGGGPDDALAADRAAEARTAPGTASKDPKSGADPKAGPVAAQVGVAEAPGRPAGGGEAAEQASKEERGTPAAGEASGPGQEKGSAQAAGGKPAAAQSAGSGAQQQAAAAPADKAEPAGGAQASSPGRDSHVSGGSNSDASGGASANAAAGAQHEPSGGGTTSRTEQPPARTEAATEKSAPAGGEHGKGGAAPAAAPQTAKAAPEAPRPDRRARGGAGEGTPAGRGRGSAGARHEGCRPGRRRRRRQCGRAREEGQEGLRADPEPVQRLPRGGPVHRREAQAAQGT